MKDKLLSILRDSRSYLIFGAVILAISAYGISMKASPSYEEQAVRAYIEDKDRDDDYRFRERIGDYITGEIDNLRGPDTGMRTTTAYVLQSDGTYKDVKGEDKPFVRFYDFNIEARLYSERMTWLSIYIGTATLGSLMFIYGLAMQRRRSEG